MLKPSRIENKSLRSEFHSKKCLVCQREGSDPAHIKTVGSGGHDAENNIIPLCREHHQEQHMIGIGTFCMKYSQVEDHISRLGFEVLNINGIFKVRRKYGC